MKHLALLFAAGAVSVATSVSAAGHIDLSKLPPPAKQEGVTFAKEIHPLFEESCIRCHSGDRPKAGLRLDTIEAVLKGGKEGKVVEVGNSEKSQLVLAVSRLDPEIAMPPKPRAGRGKGPGGPPNANGGTNAAAMTHPSEGAPPGPGGPGNAGSPGRKMPPPAKPLTAEQVGLVRAWIDQGAK